MGEAFISGLAVFMPNDPISNDDIESVLGLIGGQVSRSKAIILKKNGIATRHYALDAETGEMTHTNRALTAEAIRSLLHQTGLRLEDIECLACGTAGPDQLAPNHAVMVHGELGNPTCEVVSTTGVCAAGMTALKYGYLNVLSGQVGNAIVTASEVSSSGLRASNFVQFEDGQADRLQQHPAASFEADFLRWMLSDGAGAALITGKPQGPTPLRIDWIDIHSFAHEYDPCMYSGCEKLDDGTLVGWRELGIHLAIDRGHFQVKQDVKLLSRAIIEAAMKGLQRSKDKRQLNPSDYAWFLPHYSSAYFSKPLQAGMDSIGFSVNEARWFTNLAEKGNTGSASIFIMLEELVKSGRLNVGEKLLCFVPESSRFTFAFMQLTVLPPA
ncbi:beta-ketoacyl-ACP synthase III [Sphingobium yanoikuyae]|uniref:Beta-ketoacyl-ACP synthase III n=1 Tax=Sphingobium yanoikuyae TaxID=13690 RepID=A0AA43BDD5_SPHYA|nr:beta-ketoacyl-ACP synthase III [Sphingobium yanoikuyae]MDH2134235.1 beta-ketoacyl-ACP synthase III [Sphingobium yanoikuyae]MDH2151206.1 beta-ketoacyl-ACP synthase III [Sphingobium yanoikuyae]MDH2170329.1 beta-ketoacyl-ACP synthase III [Sphingobium yanoikuyae]